MQPGLPDSVRKTARSRPRMCTCLTSKSWQRPGGRGKIRAAGERKQALRRRPPLHAPAQRTSRLEVLGLADAGPSVGVHWRQVALLAAASDLAKGGRGRSAVRSANKESSAARQSRTMCGRRSLATCSGKQAHVPRGVGTQTQARRTPVLSPLYPSLALLQHGTRAQMERTGQHCSPCVAHRRHEWRPRRPSERSGM